VSAARGARSDAIVAVASPRSFAEHRNKLLDAVKNEIQALDVQIANRAVDPGAVLNGSDRNRLGLALGRFE